MAPKVTGKIVGFRETCTMVGCSELRGFAEFLCIKWVVLSNGMEIAIDNWTILAPEWTCGGYRDPEKKGWCIPVGCVQNGIMEYQCTEPNGQIYYTKMLDPTCFSTALPVKCDGPFDVCRAFDDSGRCIDCCEHCRVRPASYEDEDPDGFFDGLSTDEDEIVPFEGPPLTADEEEVLWGSITEDTTFSYEDEGTDIPIAEDDWDDWQAGGDSQSSPPPALPDDNSAGRPLPPEMGGAVGPYSPAIRRMVERFMAMEGGKKPGKIVLSGGPAPIDPAGPGRPRRKIGIKPPPYPVDPRVVRPAGPQGTGGAAGDRVVNIAKQFFPEIFVGDRVVPLSGGVAPIDPIGPAVPRRKMQIQPVAPVDPRVASRRPGLSSRSSLLRDEDE